MLYYLIRYIIIIIILSVFIIIKLIRNKRKYGIFFAKNIIPTKTLYKHKLHKRKKLHYVLYFLAFALLLAIIFYPFEGYFIRFDSLEKSIHYSIYDSYTSSISIVEDDDTVFFVKDNNNNTTYHSVAKYNDSYGLCDFNIKTNVFNVKQYSISAYDFEAIIRVDYILDKNTNKTCYFISLHETDNNNDHDSIAVYDSSGEKLKKLYSDSLVTVFCLISDKQLEHTDYFTILERKYNYV